MNNINWLMEGFDTIVSLSGKYARWLNARGKRFCFLIWAVSSIYWMVRDFQVGLYSQGIFCIVSVGLNLYGYWNWGKRGFEK